nr:helix-turn-helix transcriptional regulator [Clostridia bacterium]
MIKIGEKILTLRVNKNVTIERFAHFLGVDIETVTSWEKGESYPPLETVVLLAGYFGVTADELLGVDRSNIEERIERYVSRYEEAMDAGLLPVAIDTMHEALNHFPDSFRFKGMLMYALYCSCDRKNAVRFASGEIIALGRDILENCTDDTIRCEARRILCLHYYSDLGDSDSARELAADLPDRLSSREEILPLITDGDDKLLCIRANSAFYTASLVRSIRSCAAMSDMSDTERLAMYNLSLQIARLTHPDGDYSELSGELMDSCKAIAALHMAAGESDKALDALECAANFAVAFDNMPEP